jgi:menaquinone-dependent protoporphyrinogen oxidase
MKRITGKEGGSTDTSRDHEYTDWNKVTAYARKLALVDRE